MEVAALIFVASLLAIGLVLIGMVRLGQRHAVTPPEEEDNRALRQQALRAERQMQLKRRRVWHRIDELHALFAERTTNEERASRLLQTAATSPASEGELSMLGEVDFTIPDLQTTYELFLREDFLKPADMNRSDSPQPSA